MNALNFLEFCDLDKDSTKIKAFEKIKYLSNFIKRDCDGLSELSLIFIYKDIMKQPYKPGLIDLFEPINYGIESLTIDNINYIITIKDKKKEVRVFYGINKLDEFITNLKNIPNINLKIKESHVKYGN